MSPGSMHSNCIYPALTENGVSLWHLVQSIGTESQTGIGRYSRWGAVRIDRIRWRHFPLGHGRYSVCFLSLKAADKDGYTTSFWRDGRKGQTGPELSLAKPVSRRVQNSSGQRLMSSFHFLSGCATHHSPYPLKFSLCPSISDNAPSLPLPLPLCVPPIPLSVSRFLAKPPSLTLPLRFRPFLTTSPHHL